MRRLRTTKKKWRASYSVQTDESTGLEYASGTVLLGLAEGVTAEQASAQLSQLDFVATKSISEDDIVFGYVELDLADGVEVQEAVSKLEQLDITEAAQPDYVYHLLDGYDGADTPATRAAATVQAARIDVQDLASGAVSAQTTTINDTYAKETASTDYRWMLDAVNAYEAWDYVKGDHAVTVAILDSGMNTSHEDFVDANGTSNIVAPYSVLEGTTTMVDSYGHGTHVAGIVSAAANNAKGIAGVSYNANIMPVQVMDSGGSVTTSDARSGVQYVLNNASKYNVRVMNISFGGAMSTATSTADKAFLSALTAAENAGMVIAAAAGNNASRTYESSSTTKAGSDYAYKCFPVDFDEDLVGVINLKRSGSTYARASGSNFNISGTTTKDLGAPGSSIYSTLPTSMSAYGYKSGTSMATPCVAGVAALLFAADPNLTADQVKNALCQSAQDLGASGFDLETGYGMVDAHAALFKAVPSLKPTLTSSASMSVGKSTTLKVANSPAAVTWTWKSSNNAVATVSSAGKVTGTGPGKAVITATSSGGISLTCSVTVTAPLSAATVTVPEQTYSGAAHTPEPVVMFGTLALVKDADYTITGYSNNTNAGTATVTLAGKGYYTGSVSVSFTIAPASIAEAVVSALPQVYTGDALEPAPAVSLAGKDLSPETDYTVAYENNVKETTETSKASIVVTGAGNYTGTAVGTFEIGKEVIREVALSQDSFTYDGQAKEPSVTVKKASYYGEYQAEADDYTVSYARNVNAGTATVTVTGINLCKGSVSATFAIVPASLSAASVTAPDVVYTGAELTPDPVVKLDLAGKTVELELAADFDATFANNVNVGEAAVTVAGTGNFTGTASGTFAVKPASIATAKVSAAAQTYTGSALSPVPVVMMGSKRLTAGVDYTVAYANNVNVGAASIAVAGMGNYTGKTTCTFVIGKASLSKATVAVSGQTYTGSARKPAPTVKLNGKTLSAGTDYTVSYANNVNVGTATVKVMGTGNYKGSVSKTFKIVAKPTWSGATSIPVGGQATYTVKNGTAKVISGGTGQAEFSGKTLVGKKAGSVKLALYNSLGQKYATRTVTVYKLTGPYFVRSAVDPLMLLDIEGASTANGGNMIVWSFNGDANQQFRFELQSDGTFFMRSIKSKKMVDVSGESKDDGGNVIQWQANGGDNQRWRIVVDAANRCSFINKNSGKYLDVSGGKTYAGANVIQWPSNNGMNQKWTLTPAS